MASEKRSRSTAPSVGKKRKHSGTSSRSTPHDAHWESEADFAYASPRTLPSCTSGWDIWCLESLSIFYESNPITVDEILGKTNMQPTLDKEHAEILTQLKTCLTYDIEIDELDSMNKDNFLKDVIRGQLEATKKSILVEFAVEKCHQRNIKPVLDFLEDTVCMVIEIRDRIATEGVFRQFFYSFVSMCQLSPKSGDSHKCRANIKGVEVASFPDLRIKCIEEDAILLVQNSNQAVVSIVEVKKYESDQERLERRNTRFSPTGTSGKPSIYESLDRNVLGQHGGKLLLEWTLCCFKNRYMPGMIVSGSKVFFTLLDMSEQHNGKLLSNDELKAEDSAKIYYTEGFDILKKDERDMLMETLLRLSMFRTSGLANYRPTSNKNI